MPMTEGLVPTSLLQSTASSQPTQPVEASEARGHFLVDLFVGLCLMLKSACEGLYNFGKRCITAISGSSPEIQKQAAEVEKGAAACLQPISTDARADEEQFSLLNAARGSTTLAQLPPTFELPVNPEDLTDLYAVNPLDLSNSETAQSSELNSSSPEEPTSPISTSSPGTEPVLLMDEFHVTERGNVGAPFTTYNSSQPLRF